MPKAFVLLNLLFGRREPPPTYFQEIARFGFGPEAMKGMKICGRCGAQSAASARYCANCGEALPVSTLYELYSMGHRHCIGCGAIVPDDARFCPECGASLGGRLPEARKGD